MIPPGATIGIVGGGQLGRMLAIAAAQLGYRCHIFTPDEAPPAAAVAAQLTRGDYADAEALRRFAAQVDVATFEFENIPAGPLAGAAEGVPLFPPVRALEIAQDRLAEKNFAREQGARTADFAPVGSEAELAQAAAQVGTPALLKTRRLGYDGKGQARIDTPDDAAGAWRQLGTAPCILEQRIAYDAEFSVLLCRGADGETSFWDSPRNDHRDGILAASHVPAGAELEPAIAAAQSVARRLASALDYVGTMALEFFAMGEEALLNEMAPRVHNSGHWTIEGAATSQFENHIRAICGLPLGATARTAARVEMRNLIGDEVDEWPSILAEPGAHLHLYGKGEARPGRKMGHVTRVFDR